MEYVTSEVKNNLEQAELNFPTSEVDQKRTKYFTEIYRKETADESEFMKKYYQYVLK